MSTTHDIERPIFGRRDPDARGYFGAYGGRFVPETLVAPIEELTAGYLAARADSAFRDELERLFTHYVGRPTPLYEATRLAEKSGGGVRIFLKREDLTHTGAHKINNALGQALLARARLRDDARLAKSSREQRLAERVVDLVGAGVGEVLPLEVQAEGGGQPRGPRAAVA